MGFSDKLKQLGDKAKEAAAERKDQISSAVESAGVVADKRTHGKYTEKIQKATEKTAAYVEKLAPEEEGGESPSAAAAPPAGESTPPAAPAPTTESAPPVETGEGPQLT
jgi:hypothetical protein